MHTQPAGYALRAWQYLKTFFKWVFVSVAVGLLGGGAGILFLYGIRFAGTSFDNLPWLLFLLPAAGLVIVGIYHLCRLPDSTGTNEVLAAVYTEKTLPPLLAPLILVSTVLTHLFGGSAGREGAALQLGGGIGTPVGRAVRFDERDMHLVVLTGMSAVFSALFGTPLTAAFFALEVVSVGVMYYAALGPCLLSALIACKLASLAGFSPVAFSLLDMESLGVPIVVQSVVLSILCALLSILFCVTMHKTAHLMQRIFKSAYLRIAVGGAVIVLLTLLVGSRDYNGVGAATLAKALSGVARPEAFVWKLVFTAITLGSGFKGGEIVPSFFVGATFGATVAPLIGLDPALGAAIGLIALFCGITNCPVASLFLAIEIFGGACMPLFGITVAVAYALSGNFGVYTKQRLLYSKLRAEFIDATTH